MRKPTEKQKKFIKGVKLENKSMRRAALDAGYSVNVADNATPNILEKLGTQQALNDLQKAYRDAGITEEVLAKMDFAMLFADKKSFTGETIEDWTARDRAIERAKKVLGYEDKQKADIDVTGSLNIQIINFNDKKPDVTI